MPTATTTYDENLPPFRLNVVVALFEAMTSNLFVGTLLPRDKDKRAYTTSLIEGGIDKGETVQQAALREILEEVGVTDAHFLAAVRRPLLYPFQDALDAPVKYAGKQGLVLCFLVPSSDQIKFTSAIDPEGSTFAPIPLSHCWFSFREAASMLRQGSHTPTHQHYINELTTVLSPVVDALETARKNNMDLWAQPSGFLAHKLDQKAYTDVIPEPFPILAPTLVRARLRSLADAC